MDASPIIMCGLCGKSRAADGCYLCTHCQETTDAASKRALLSREDLRHAGAASKGFLPVDDLKDTEIKRLQTIINGMADRITIQSVMLSDRAEKKDAENPLSGYVSREEMLKQCIETITKHRTSCYGTPEDNFSDIAAMWTTYKGVEFAPHDIAVMMILLKIVRSKNSPTRPDHYLDIAGYAACGCEIVTKYNE